MKLYFVILLVLLSTSNQNNEQIVQQLLIARNQHDFNSMRVNLHPDFKEYFLNGQVEIENLNQLRDLTLWGKHLNAAVQLKSILTNGDTVKTIEAYMNDLDRILERPMRTFKVSYIFKDTLIHKVTLDTLSGYSRLAKLNTVKMEAFNTFCSERKLDLGNSMDSTSGYLLKKALDLYVIEGNKTR